MKTSAEAWKRRKRMIKIFFSVRALWLRCFLEKKNKSTRFYCFLPG